MRRPHRAAGPLTAARPRSPPWNAHRASGPTAPGRNAMRTSLRALATASLATALIGSGPLVDATVPRTVTREPYGPETSSTVITDLCSFPVTVAGTQSGYVVTQDLPSGGQRLI